MNYTGKYKQQRFFLNIGLVRNTGGIMRLCTAVEAVESKFDILAVEQRESATELTAVFICEWEGDYAPDGIVHGIAEELSQDCIAYWDEYTGRGELFGPEAEAWGQFSPEHFIFPTAKGLRD